MVRDTVRKFVDLGPLPSEDTASIEQLQALQDLLEQITRPVTNEEARIC